jgi:predicted anti-sigma-YlaC factor YlaD
MRCEEVQTQLSALLDGELTSETAAVIEGHLAGCMRCSEARNEISALLEMTTEWNIAGGDVLTPVRQQIQQDTLHALLLEMQRLRSEVDSLRTEFAELKSRAARLGPTPGRESSLLRFPYAAAQNVPRTIL